MRSSTFSPVVIAALAHFMTLQAQDTSTGEFIVQTTATLPTQAQSADPFEIYTSGLATPTVVSIINGQPSTITSVSIAAITPLPSDSVFLDPSAISSIISSLEGLRPTSTGTGSPGSNSGNAINLKQGSILLMTAICCGFFYVLLM